MKLWRKKRHVGLRGGGTGIALVVQTAHLQFYDLLRLLVEILCVDGGHFVRRIAVNAQIGYRAFANDGVPDVNLGFQCGRLKASEFAAEFLPRIVLFVVVFVRKLSCSVG